MRRLLSLVMVGVAGYYAYRNRYMLMNNLLGNSFIRRIFVSSLMSVPGVRNSMMRTAFSGPPTDY